MEVLLDPDVLVLIAWLAGAFIFGSAIMAVTLYVAEFLGWMSQ